MSTMMTRTSARCCCPLYFRTQRPLAPAAALPGSRIPRAAERPPLRLRTLLAVLLAVCVLAAAAPRALWAASIELPQTAIEVTVLEDGRLAVTEQRTFAFDDDVNGVFWTIPLATNEQGQVSSFVINSVSERAEDGTERTFTQVEAAQNGDSGVYTAIADSSEVEVKLFTPHEDGDESVVTLSYTLSGAVMAWADTAELYWQFVGPAWEEDSSDVALTVRFPVAEQLGASPTVGDDFRAWGHGPLDATVALDATVPQVTYTVPRVRTGEFAEARIAFPRSWVPALAASGAASGETRLPTILNEEEAWAADANARREDARRRATVVSVAHVALPAALLVAVIVLRVRHGANPKARFHETYFRDIPSDDHPAVIAAFMRNGTVDERAFVSTLMKLTDDRVISLTAATGSEAGLFGRKETEEYRVQLLDRARATDPIDRAALDLFFGPDAPDGATRAFASLKADAEHDEDRYEERVDAFKDEVMAALDARGLIDASGGRIRGGIFAAGLGVLVISGLLLVVTDAATLPAFGIGVVLLVPAAVLATSFGRVTQAGAELKARLEALKRWLEDFTRLDEAVPADVVLWNRMLVLAAALGVSDEVLRELADAVPDAARRGFDEDDPFAYYPLYWWFYPRGRLGSPVHELDGAYTASVGALMASSNSSGAGLGGGFSGGGGGGVGGGGGGSF